MIDRVPVEGSVLEALTCGHECVAFMHNHHVFNHGKEIRALKLEKGMTPATTICASYQLRNQLDPLC